MNSLDISVKSLVPKNAAELSDSEDDDEKVQTNPKVEFAHLKDPGLIYCTIDSLVCHEEQYRGMAAVVKDQNAIEDKNGLSMTGFEKLLYSEIRKQMSKVISSNLEKYKPETRAVLA